MRSGAYEAAQQFINAVAGVVVVPEDPKAKVTHETKKLGFGDILCWVARIVGCGMFVVSFGAFALPWIGFTWVEALVVFSVGILLSGRMMNFYHLWYEFTGTVQLVWSKYKSHDSMRLWIQAGQK
jgi:hypothetical protein